MEALEKDFQDLVDSEEVLQEDEADDTSPADLSDEVSADDELIDEKSAAQDIVDKVLSEEDDDITDEQQEIIEFLLSELDEEDLDLISELDEEEDWDATLDSIFEKKTRNGKIDGCCTDWICALGAERFFRFMKLVNITFCYKVRGSFNTSIN